jgi:hypothetical protein
MKRPGGSIRARASEHCFGAILLGLTLTTSRAGASDEGALPHFSRAPRQWALAGTLELGLSARSVASFGYGQPHWFWLGLDLRSTVASTFAAQGAGLRWVLPLGELGLQSRRLIPYERRVPLSRSSYTAEQLASELGGVDYRAVEAWLTAYAPLFGGVAYACVWVDRISGVPRGHYLYDEVTRAVVGAPWVGSEQLAYMVPLARGHYLGPFAEHVWSSRRAGSVWRAGAGYYASFGPHLSLLGYLTVPFASPDQLGLAEGSGGSVSLSYAWSSTDPEPGWP